MVMVPPMVVMTVLPMALMLPMAVVMVLPMALVLPMAVMMMVMVPPLHVGRQLAGVALPNGDARGDRSRRLRLLRGSRDNQKRAESGKS